jgi:hypothetical protein
LILFLLSGIFVMFFKGSDFAFGHKCEETRENHALSQHQKIRENGQIAKCEIFSKTRPLPPFL